MKAKKIISYLDQGRIKELRELLSQEIEKKKNKKVDSFKCVLSLSQQAEIDQRIPKSKNKLTGFWSYVKPTMAGAYFMDNKTMITNGYWAIMMNQEINGLQMVKEKTIELIDLNRVFTFYTTDWPKIDIAYDKLVESKKEEKEKYIEINGKSYELKPLLLLYGALKNPIISQGPKFLYLQSNEGEAILMNK